MSDCPHLEWQPTVIEGIHLRDVACDFNGKPTYVVGVEPGHYYLLWRTYIGVSTQGDYSSIAEAKSHAQKEQERRWAIR